MAAGNHLENTLLKTWLGVSALASRKLYVLENINYKKIYLPVLKQQVSNIEKNDMNCYSYIWIVMPVHNRKNLTQVCLQSLFSQTYSHFQVVVVDDGSTDGTSEMIENLFTDVILLKGDGDLWWTGAIKRGISYILRKCKSDDYILVINDDLIVPETYLETFMQISRDNPDSCIGSVVTDINQKDLIISGGININWLTAKITNLNKGKRLSCFPRGYVLEVSTLTGRGVLFPSEAFRRHGLYNDRHYKQCGDTELPRRLHKAGYKLMVAYDTPVFTHPSDDNHINARKRYGIGDIKKYFWDIRSNQNLRYRFWFAYDCANRFLWGTVFLFCDVCRIGWHFLRRLELTRIN